MPIFDLNSILPYLFTIVFVTGAGCFFTPSLLLFIVVIISIAIPGARGGAPSRPTRSVAVRWDAGNVAQTEKARLVDQTPMLDRLAMQGGILTALPTDNIIAANVGGSTSRGKIGPNLKHELDLIDEQFRLNYKTPSDVYPANKISVRCGGCRKRLLSGEGYMHYNIGERKTFCLDCHVSQGLPLRDEDAIKIMSSDTIGEAKVEV